MVTENKKKGVDSAFSLRNILVALVIVVIIVTFIFMGDSFLGLGKFFSDLGKEKIQNADGTYSIPADAQAGENGNNPNSYVGRVGNELIQLGANDEFNMNLQRVFATTNLSSYEKYQYTRYFFDRAINKIIGMNNAKKMNIAVSKEYLLKETGKRYYTDEEGDIDYNLMEEDTTKLAERSKDVRLDLLYQNYVMDFFSGLPVSQTEAFNNYKFEETKIKLKYINLSSQYVSDDKLQAYFNENKNSFRQFRLVRMVFKNKADAEANLSAVIAEPSKFFETGNKLKDENKVVNVITDTDFTYSGDFEDTAINDAVKNVSDNKVVLNSVFETSVGSAILMVDEIRDANYDNNTTKTKVKNQYIAQNISEVNSEISALANNIYQTTKSNNIDVAGKQYNLAVETMPNAVAFMDYGFPLLSSDNTDDLQYIIKAFKANAGDTIEPYKYSSGNGYIIAVVEEKNTADQTKFEEQNNDIIKKYAENKSAYLENDFYQKEKSKYKVVDNFNYVFKIQDFMKE